jgi:hypothetical protein
VPSAPLGRESRRSEGWRFFRLADAGKRPAWRSLPHDDRQPSAPRPARRRFGLHRLGILLPSFSPDESAASPTPSELIIDLRLRRVRLGRGRRQRNQPPSTLRLPSGREWFVRNRASSDIGPYSIVPQWITRADISDRAVRLFALLARHADRDHKAFPSRSTLATALRTSVDSVDRACRELVSLGAVRVEGRRDQAGDRISNNYHLTFAAPQQVAAPLWPPSRTPAATVAAPARHRTITTGTSTPVSEETGDNSSSNTPTVTPAESLQTLWNEVTTLPIPRCRELHVTRRKYAEARLRDRGLEGMREVFTIINGLPFCRGENDRNWRADFDWALKPTSIAKVLEGNYASGARRTMGRAGRVNIVRGGAPQPAEWRAECAAHGHEPNCSTPERHELRKAVAEAGCKHPGICQTLTEHQSHSRSYADGAPS